MLLEAVIEFEIWYFFTIGVYFSLSAFYFMYMNQYPTNFYVNPMG